MLAAAVCLVFAPGCVSRRSADSFDKIRTAVGSRAGQRIVWHQDKADFTVATERVNALLAEDLSLEHAVEIALINNPRLQATYESIGVAEAQVVEAMLPPNPSFEALYKNIRHGGHIWELMLVQEVVDLVMIPWRKQAAELGAERVRAEVTASVLDILLDVKVAYRDAQASAQVLRTVRTTRKSEEAAYGMAQELRNAGNISKLQLKGRRAVLEQARLAESSAELQLAERREALNILLGLLGEQAAWQIATDLPPPSDEMLSYAEIRQAAEKNSLDLAMARATLLQVAEEEGITNVTSILPELHLGVEGEREPDGTWVVGPMIEFPLPLFDWGQAERAIARSAVRRASDMYVATAVKLDAAARLTARRLELTGRQAADYAETMLPLQKEMTRETQLHFNAMQLGVFQLLAAKKEELAVQRQYINALRNFWIAQAEAEHLMNGRMLDASAVAARDPMGMGGASQGQGGH